MITHNKVALLLPLLFCAACANVMSAYYQRVGDAATLVSSGYRALDAKDKEVQAEISKQVAKDPVGAQARLAAHLSTYDHVRTVLGAAEAVVQAAHAAGPIIEAATNRTTLLGEWIAKLTTLAIDVTAALAALGIRGTP